ncbi:uncharacterized protein SPPG_03110 [Spizellomyces punctatus DAOM BR117]|uniref:Uncharacterized protein n=1 Tax=Spizellomyces punctatus (strain DAOM BR117) TaxID=645134 RepID=A0A0L0HIM5_SPIPD|nr:uncharacterized protein SPPG_03110 [Spizellomyces punctatus DAOM BR117]KND01301.1 hypothetical protein SPPG_03110 [Spizellomyces punctatus DAOM BR117]|eukprot:XP_016609340.1 hypothetical protein SPPG_03110 [Spizellomyces punctatus DAOM BR117]
MQAPASPPPTPPIKVLHKVQTPTTHLTKWHNSTQRRRGPSDIVFGDHRHFPHTDQFLSTMRTDYDGQRLDPANIKVAQETAANRCGPDVHVPVGPAGKPLGINTADKREGHIAFGDRSKVSDSHFESVTDSSYKCPPPITAKISRGMGAGESDINVKNLPPSQQFHHKALTAISAAHVGLETRKDLPIDDKRFHNYVTTHQAAYATKGTMHDVAEGKGQAGGYCRNNRASDIPLGDPAKERNYDTMARKSYIDHGRDAYTKPKIIPPPRPARNLLAMDARTNNEDATFTSTTAQTYKGHTIHPIHRETQVNPGQLSSKSSIALGEEGAQYRQTETSVSRRDYVHDPQASQAARHLARSSVADRLLSKPGIHTAIQPNPVAQRDLESSTSASYRVPEHMAALKPLANRRSAGVRSIAAMGTREGNGHSKADMMAVSTVPTGDPTHFNFNTSTTTNSTFYQPYENFKMIPHPILGANITKSSFKFSEPEDELKPADRFRSSTHSAFIPHDVTVDPVVHRRPPRSTLHLDGSVEALPMWANETTQQAHYRPPVTSAVHDRHGRYMAVAPKSTAKPLLFPVKTAHITPDQIYQSTTHKFFRSREGLNFEHGENMVDRKVRRGMRGSSVPFGDQTVSYYKELTVKKGPEPVVAAS